MTLPIRTVVLTAGAALLSTLEMTATAAARDAAVSVTPTVSTKITKAKSEPQGASTLIIQVENVEPDDAVLIIDLYANKADYITSTPFLSQTIQAKGAEATATFNDISEGYYAYSILHDKDGDGKLSTVSGSLEPIIRQGLNVSETDVQNWADAKFLLPRGRMIRTSAFNIQKTDEIETIEADNTFGAKVVNFIREF